MNTGLNTPEGKAKELVDMFYRNVWVSANDSAKKMYARRFASDCVDEILKALDNTFGGNDDSFSHDYYRQVKQHLLKS